MIYCPTLASCCSKNRCPAKRRLAFLSPFDWGADCSPMKEGSVRCTPGSQKHMQYKLTLFPTKGLYVDTSFGSALGNSAS